MTTTTNPFFSIIIPSCNPNISSLADCLQTIEIQSCNHWETIVIDALSPQSDAVRLECSRIKHTHFLVDMEASGVYPAINQAIHASKGDWILVLGHDDKLANECVLQKVKNLIQKKRFLFWRQGYYGNVIIDGNAGWANDGEIYAGKFNFGDLALSNICHQAIFCRGSSARLKGREYSNEFKITSDWDYNIRAWTRGGMGYLPIVVSIFKGGGLSAFSGIRWVSWARGADLGLLGAESSFLVCVTFGCLLHIRIEVC